MKYYRDGNMWPKITTRGIKDTRCVHEEIYKGMDILYFKHLAHISGLYCVCVCVCVYIYAHKHTHIVNIQVYHISRNEAQYPLNHMGVKEALFVDSNIGLIVNSKSHD